jgi:predicted permease
VLRRSTCIDRAITTKNSAMETIAEIFRDLLIFVVAMFALLIVLIVVIAKLPDDNPLKRVLTALCYRVGATAAAGLIAVPVEPIPLLDLLYDVGVPVLLIIYWIGFFKNAYRIMSEPPTRGGPPTISHKP